MSDSNDPGYVYNVAGNYYEITGAAGTDVTLTASNTTVFGGVANLTYSGGESTVVLNGGDMTGPAQVTGYGGDTIWAGTSVLTFSSVHYYGYPIYDTIVLGANSAPPSLLQLFLNDQTSQTRIINASAAGTTAHIHAYQDGHVTLFGGAGDLDVAARRTTFVLNGHQTGNAYIDSIGNNTIFAGQGNLTLIEGFLETDDTLVTGSGKTTVIATDYGTNTLHVFDGGQNGTLTYVGGGQNATFDLSTGTATIFAGGNPQDITLSDTVSATVVGGGNSTGMQFIHAAGDTGALQVWGGAEAIDVAAGAGATDIHGGTGALSVVAGSGSLSADLALAATTLQLNGFSAGIVDISNFSAGRDTASFASGSVRDQQVVGGSLVVQMQDGNTATFHGLASTSGISFG